MININLLRNLCKIPAAPGFEQQLREEVISLVSPYVDEVTTDAMGNVYALKKGNLFHQGFKGMQGEKTLEN